MGPNTLPGDGLRRRARRRRGAGFTYLGILFAVTLMGIALMAVGELYSTAARREKERELLFVGQQYARALRLYFKDSGGVYPRELSKLLGSDDDLRPQRWLRRLYRDPITNKEEWGLVKSPEGAIVGVHSLSEERPLKTANFPDSLREFDDKTKYSEWKFVAGAPAQPALPAGQGPTPPTAQPRPAGPLPPAR